MQTKKQANLFLYRFACFKVGVTEVTDGHLLDVATFTACGATICLVAIFAHGAVSKVLGHFEGAGTCIAVAGSVVTTASDLAVRSVVKADGANAAAICVGVDLLSERGSSYQSYQYESY